MSEKPTSAWVAALRNTIENVWDHELIVIGLDIDSFASACILQKRYPTARVIGLYETEYIVQLVQCSQAEFQAMLRRALWVDQDVLGNFLCIGQHLTTGDCKEPIPGRNVNSFNPNVFFNQPYAYACRQNTEMQAITDATDLMAANMRSKYPYSTLVMLLHVYDTYWERNDNLDALIRHADSAAANMYQYSINCDVWRRLMFNDASQVSKLLLTTHSIYSHQWKPACDKNCTGCRIHMKRDCVCAHCSIGCASRLATRKAFQLHVECMVNLEKSMPRYFDCLSRKVDKKKKVVGSGEMRKILDSNVADDTETVEQEAKRARTSGTCKHQYVSMWIDLFGGYQGLKLGKCQGKLRPNFDTDKFLVALQAGYAFVATAFGIANPQVFATAFPHFVQCACTTTIFSSRNQAGHVVTKVASCDGSEKPLNEFITQDKIFSYAILSRAYIRYTIHGEITK